MYIQPVGVNPVSDEDRQPVWRVIGGDTLKFETRLYFSDGITPVTPSNSELTFKLSEVRFDENVLATCTWGDGIEEVDAVDHPGLVCITIDDEVGDTLRRGVYHFSVQVTELDNYEVPVSRYTPITGDMIVEVEPTSPEKNIPYKSGPDYDNE
jgi:hypothetical protein